LVSAAQGNALTHETHNEWLIVSAPAVLDIVCVCVRAQNTLVG